jgi:hypothetical protein
MIWRRCYLVVVHPDSYRCDSMDLSPLLFSNIRLMDKKAFTSSNIPGTLSLPKSSMGGF